MSSNPKEDAYAAVSAGQAVNFLIMVVAFASVIAVGSMVLFAIIKS
jgi:hypothetical protein